MKKLYLFSGDEKYIEKCKKFFNYFEINIIDKKAIMENVDIETSNILYNDYVNRNGIEWADKWSAKPGFSEHQTGLALDITTSSATFDNFEDTEAYDWLVNNSYKYGFILRYPSDDYYLTGYNFESWHFRYVGVDVATKIYNEKITFEEYYEYYVK